MEDKSERRSFDKGFEEEVVRLVAGGGWKVPEVGRGLDIHPKLIH